MTDTQPAAPTAPAARSTPAEDTRRLLRQALKGALATPLAGSGHPYASLVTVAATPAGEPLLLLSTLAVHTRNIAADARASLLIDGTDATGDPLAGGRATFVGRIEPMQRELARARFLARHPGAAVYADFADFGFYRLHVEHAHFIGGFGRIVDIARGDLVAGEHADSLVAAEAEIVQHVNEDHADVLPLYATRLAGGRDGPWRLTGVDPAGLDLVLDGIGLRIEFPEPATSPGAVRRALAAMAAEARSRTT